MTITPERVAIIILLAVAIPAIAGHLWRKKKAKRTANAEEERLAAELKAAGFDYPARALQHHANGDAAKVDATIAKMLSIINQDGGMRTLQNPVVLSWFSKYVDTPDNKKSALKISKELAEWGADGTAAMLVSLVVADVETLQQAPQLVLETLANPEAMKKEVREIHDAYLKKVKDDAAELVRIAKATGQIIGQNEQALLSEPIEQLVWAYLGVIMTDAKKCEDFEKKFAAVHLSTCHDFDARKVKMTRARTQYQLEKEKLATITEHEIDAGTTAGKVHLRSDLEVFDKATGKKLTPEHHAETVPEHELAAALAKINRERAAAAAAQAEAAAAAAGRPELPV